MYGMYGKRINLMPKIYSINNFLHNHIKFFHRFTYFPTITGDIERFNQIVIYKVKITNL